MGAATYAVSSSILKEFHDFNLDDNLHDDSARIGLPIRRDGPGANDLPEAGQR